MDIYNLCLAEFQRLERQFEHWLNENSTGAMLDPSQRQIGLLGGMHGCVGAKLLDFEELGYFTSYSLPCGKLYIRGPSVV